MALTKAEMSEYLFDKLGLSKRDAKELVELFFEEIRRALENGEQVKLSGFGNFDLRDKNQRPGRNPKTGEDIPITARRVVTFRPGQKLKAGSKTLRPKTSNLITTKRPLCGLLFNNRLIYNVLSLFVPLCVHIQWRERE